MSSFYLFLIFNFLVVLEFELRALHFVCGCSSIWTMITTLFAFNYFSYQVLCFLPRLTWMAVLLSLLLMYLELWNILPHPDCLLRWSLPNIFPTLTSNCDCPDLHLTSSWDCRHELLCQDDVIILISVFV
jgi:hypothetical protein